MFRVSSALYDKDRGLCNALETAIWVSAMLSSCTAYQSFFPILNAYNVLFFGSDMAMNLLIRSFRSMSASGFESA